MKQLRKFLIGISLCLAAGGAQGAHSQAAYRHAMQAAMTKMMARMQDHSSDVDQDFVKMMIPHHQGAIDMAVAELRYGKNPQLKRIAQEIIIDQQQEIAAMDLAMGAALPRGDPAPTRPSNDIPGADH